MYIWIIAALVAFFIKGLCGFANTLVFTSILGFRADNVNISPVELILGYPANLILVWKNRKLLDHRIWLPLSLLLLAGSIPGALLLKNVDAGALKIVFGVMVILIALEML
ncbi:MAG: sulfite exporter TauE/SafE family protein, partial [Lachnospiraceae bacterium]|nr:sulfite exporter TauE/SafE family protein [Lachnospiraceae bacterium]